MCKLALEEVMPDVVVVICMTEDCAPWEAYRDIVEGAALALVTLKERDGNEDKDGNVSVRKLHQRNSEIKAKAMQRRLSVLGQAFCH